MYIVIEGVDTCGKSTQIELLKGVFVNAIFTKEPGGTKIGHKLREILLGDNMLDSRAEFLLFLADRAQHRFEVLESANSKLIISDRGVLSGMAYADGKFEDDFIVKTSLFSMSGIVPDLVVLLELDQDELRQRLGDKVNDRIEKKGIDYLLVVQNNIMKYAKKIGIEVLKIDAKLDKMDICNQIVKKIEELNV